MMNRRGDSLGRTGPTAVSRQPGMRWLFLATAIICMSLTVSGMAGEPDSEPKSIRKMCGTCPDGYAMTAITSAPELCKEGDPTLVQCVPLGANLLAVCGQCPDGYREIGRSNVVTRCGGRDGGLLTQCQQEQLDSTLPDPTRGGVTCPPDCGNTGTAGEGGGAPPPKFRPAPPGTPSP
jgi:hypothetical protein